MSQEQIKNLLVNIATGAIVVGIIFAGYFVFKSKQPVVVSDGVNISPETNAAETVVIGVEIARTVMGLQDLKNSVESSATVFGMPAFKNLQDFSVAVPPEAIGRIDPFVPTDWKIRAKALEEAIKKQPNQNIVGPSGI